MDITWDGDDEEKILKALVGRTVVRTSMETDPATLTLDNGVVLEVERQTDDCCSYIELSALHTTENVITKAGFADTEDLTGGEGGYRAYLYVVTDGGVKAIVEADGDASNGYYLHGFALDITVREPATEESAE